MRRAAIASALLASKLALGLWILHLGFSQISDDDWARVVIAQSFASAPKLDPSGTSWLPFPFWLNGTIFLVFGRSLVLARAVAVLIGLVSIGFAYRALCRFEIPRMASAIAAFIACAVPLSAWLGVATVPEHGVAALVLIAVLGASAPVRSIAPGFCLVVAALSRYETWPVCAVVCVASTLRAIAGWKRDPKEARRDAIVAGLAVLGPLSWMLWNAHAHGDPFHFFARVSAYRAAHGGAETGVVEKWVSYPRALALHFPESIALAVAGAIACGQREFRRRWCIPLAAAFAVLVFLVVGDLKNGGPTHHPERALLSVAWLLIAFGVAGSASLFLRFAWGNAKRESYALGAVVAILVGWFGYVASAYNDFPHSVDSDRRAQLARGRELKTQSVEHFTVTPCAYEHFALLAAFEYPERVTTRTSSNASVTSACPAIEIP